MGFKKKYKKWFLILILIVLTVGYWLWKTIHISVPQYKTLIVSRNKLEQSILASGSLDAFRKIDVSSQISGQLKTLSVNIGDQVKKDQLLGVIDSEQAKNQLKEVEAVLMELRAKRKQVEAEHKLAVIMLARQKRLAKEQVTSHKDFDISVTELAIRKSQLDAINAQIRRNLVLLDQAKNNLNYTRIIAPISGEVTQITTFQGQTIIAAQQVSNILTLADMSMMVLKAQISEADVIHLRPGQKAWFTILGDPKTRYESILKDILPTPEKFNNATFYYARFETKNPKRILRLNMTAQVHIQFSDEKDVLTIPLMALGESIGDNRYKVKVLQKNKVCNREIVIGSHNNTDVTVIEGLKEGEEIIVSEN